MNPDDRGTLWHVLAAVLAVLWLTWLLVPALQPGVAFLFAVWLLLTAWMFTKG